MSEASALQSPSMVARSRYVHVRALLAAAAIAIVGLTIAVVLLASSQGGSGTSVAPINAGSSVFQSGAKLDHRGLDTSQSSAAQAGARLDHNGS